jgi:3-hydroxyisobutyrate dehydrogenase-like beta-hydroxyacid dehydrogenase
MAEQPTIGFIGLGTMGARIAGNFQKAGYRLVVHDLRRDAADPLLSAGAAWADTPASVARATSVIFTSLPGPPDVESVVLAAMPAILTSRPIPSPS